MWSTQTQKMSHLHLPLNWKFTNRFRRRKINPQAKQIRTPRRIRTQASQFFCRGKISTNLSDKFMLTMTSSACVQTSMNLVEFAKAMFSVWQFESEGESKVTFIIETSKMFWQSLNRKSGKISCSFYENITSRLSWERMEDEKWIKWTRDMVLFCVLKVNHF